MKKALLAAGIAALAACSDATSPTQVPVDGLRPTTSLALGNNTVTVREADVTRAAEGVFPSDNWMLYTRPTADVESGDFVAGPGSPPLGNGSFRTVTVAGGSKVYLFNYDHAGTALSAIEGISYSTYKAPGVTAVAFPSLNIEIDINGGSYNTGEFRTLVFEPYVQPGFADATGVWEPRDAFNGGNAKWWSTTGGVVNGANGCGQSTPCTWTDILAAFPGATIVAGVGINQGSGNPAVDGSSDALSIAYGGNSVTYDFEDSACYFIDNPAAKTMTLTADCETSVTIQVPQDYTLVGDGHTITAVNPASGSFSGAVVRNGGTVASVTDVTISTAALTGCMDGDSRLRGIMLDGAAGSITNNTVRNIKRAGTSGCQEGNAIEARNAPFEKGGSDVAVAIADNVISDYQKTGIVANGSVFASITDNHVTGLGPIDYIAQNGIQVGFGATATVRNNTMGANNYTPADTESCGLLLYLADGVKASANKFFANEVNQCNAGKGGGKVTASN